MAKPNYQFEKRQRELEKKRKKEEKAHRKAAGPQSEAAAGGIDALICPICGEPNQCEAAASGDPNAPCWCRAVSFSPEVLARIPAEARGLACVCRQCAGVAQA